MKLKNKLIKTPFTDLDDTIQKKYLIEIAACLLLCITSFIFLFFIEIKLAIFLVSCCFILLLSVLYSLYLFLSNKVYYMDAEYMGVWEATSKLSKAKKFFWNKTVKKQETICLKANDENYIVTINKLPPLIIGDYVRVFATSESIYKGTDGIYRVSSVMHIYKIKKEQEEIDD